MSRKSERAQVVADAETIEAPAITPAQQWRLDRETWDDEYRRGLHPLAQIRPGDRPPLEVQRDFHGALQDWLAENAPALTLEACRREPAPLRRGFTLLIPGDGVQTLDSGEDDE